MSADSFGYTSGYLRLRGDERLMDMLGTVAALAHEFPDLPTKAVVRAVKQSVDQVHDGDERLITATARAKLSKVRGAGPGD